jgi:hypothetical protein
MNHEQHPTVQAIDQQLRDLKAACDAAEGDRARLALQAMTDKKAGAKLTNIEAELAGYAAGIDRATAARRAAVEQAAAEFGQHKADLLAQSVQDAISATRQRIESAARIEKAIADLGKALEQNSASGVLAWSALSKCSGLVGSVTQVLALHDSAIGNGSASAATVALFHALTRANSLGGARVHVDFPGLNSSAEGSVAEGAKSDLQRIEREVARWTIADDNETPPAPAPAVVDTPGRTRVIDGTTQIVGMEGSQHV